MSSVLLVDDNAHIVKINAAALTLRGYDVYTAASAEECRGVLDARRVDLIVLDVMLPDGNGIELCRELKQACRIPILFLSAMGESADIVNGLRAGGDDYMAKPYDLEVLIARIEARLRTASASPRYVCYRGLRLDTVSLCRYIDGRDMLLTQKEFSALLLLAKSAESAVPGEVVCRELWNGGREECSSALWTLISRLRKKLDSESSGLCISMQRNGGYTLETM